MADSAGTPGDSDTNALNGDVTDASPSLDDLSALLGQKGTPNATPDDGNGGGGGGDSDGGGGNQDNNNNNKKNNNNNNDNSTTAARSPPSASPPPPSPPPASPPPLASPPPGKSPPPQQASASPPPPPSPLPAQSKAESPPPPAASSPPNQDKKSPPSPPGQASASPASPPPPAGQSNQGNQTPASTGNTDPSASKFVPPAQPNSPPAPTSSNSGTSSTPNELSPPSNSESSSSKSSPEGSSSSSNSQSNQTPATSSGNSNASGDSSNTDDKAIIGATVAGVFLLALVAIFFVARGRRKRRRGTYANHYMPPPKNLNEKAAHEDAYYYNQNYQMGNSGPVDTYYGSQIPQMISYGSPREVGGGYHGGGPDSGILAGSKSIFTHEELMEITNGFAQENVIGEGGFGYVYKGTLPDGKVVAIKQLKAGSGQGEREFRAEVEIISRVHHRHLVSLVGYCISEKNRLLIYEFVPNNNLEHHLHGKGQPVLEWTKRVKIAIGAAKGLAYLHEDCHPKIIHRDIKSANILLDDEFEAQVADFGLAKLNDTNQTHVSTRVMGTFGYLAPEYASSGKLTDRSDVFSFGVVLLELITGRKPVDPTQPLGDESLVEWARPVLVHAIETGNLSELVDPRLEKHYVESEMFRMVEAAAACVRHSGPKRPRMVQVVRALDSAGETDLSNGVKYGQSTIYDSGQYNQDIMMFRKMALGCEDSSEFSGEYTSRDASRGHSSALVSQETSGEFTSIDSETRAINQRSRDRH